MLPMIPIKSKYIKLSLFNLQYEKCIFSHKPMKSVVTLVLLVSWFMK